MGWLYVRVFYGLRDWFFKPMPIPKHIKPAIGGLLLGVLALKFPEVMTGGYGWVQWGAIGMPPELALPDETQFFVPHMGMWMLLTLAVLKIVATGLTISSGGSGGVFGPSMLIGGMLGGACGQFLLPWVPGAAANPGPFVAAFVLVGMGGFFAGVSKTPLTSIVMVSEMTGSYSLLVPLMLACGLNMALSRRWTIYEEQVPTPIDSPAHQGDFVVDVLEQLSVGEVGVRTLGIEKVLASTPFNELIHLVARSTETLFPVVDRAGRLTGIFTLRDLRIALVGSDWGPLVLADDLAHRPVLTVTPEDNLHTALRRMTELNIDELPVVDPKDPTHLLGLLSRRQLTLAYTSLIESLLRSRRNRLHAESVRGDGGASRLISVSVVGLRSRHSPCGSSSMNRLSNARPRARLRVGSGGGAGRAGLTPATRSSQPPHAESVRGDGGAALRSMTGVVPGFITNRGREML